MGWVRGAFRKGSFEVSQGAVIFRYFGKFHLPRRSARLPKFARNSTPCVAKLGGLKRATLWAGISNNFDRLNVQFAMAIERETIKWNEQWNNRDISKHSAISYTLYKKASYSFLSSSFFFFVLFIPFIDSAPFEIDFYASNNVYSPC